MNISILIPTYNEARNIEILIAALGRIAEVQKSISFEAIVVDDNSPDGTALAAERAGLALDVPNFRVTILGREKKEGLGKAYIYAFKNVLARPEKPDYVMQMDADFSHDPKYIPEFLAAAEGGADFVVGTRYVQGGATPDWSWYRKLLSSGGNLYARLVLGSKITDYTGGFNMYATSLLQKINFNALDSAGYGFLINLKYVAMIRSRKIAQVPIVFLDRQHGNSKMPANTIIKNFFLVVKVKFSGGKG